MSSIDSGSESGSPTLLRRFIALRVIAPLAALSIGVDGGEIFQILAIEELELQPRAIGIALGLGTLSIPLQLWAARIPLERARQNLRLHVAVLGLMAFITALLVALATPGSIVAGLALVIAVLAEISVSVLYATSWEPMVSYSLSAPDRQHILGFGRAMTGVALLVSVVAFGQMGQGGRVAFLIAVGLGCLVLAWSLHLLPHPRSDRDATPETDSLSTADARSRELRNLFIALAATAFAGWPLLLTWVALVLWPTVNLGLLGAALAVGSIVTSLLWRDPGDNLFILLKTSAVAAAVCAVGIAVIPGPIDSTGWGMMLFGLIVVGSASRSLISIGLTELAHRRVNSHNSVRVMTMFDVVGSTSFQLGFFVAGFLIAASQDSSATFDPYQLGLIASGVMLVVAVSRIRPLSPQS
jgi:hypothetical protein